MDNTKPNYKIYHVRFSSKVTFLNFSSPYFNKKCAPINEHKPTPRVM